jgi:hypothetical protein
LRRATLIAPYRPTRDTDGDDRGAEDPTHQERFGVSLLSKKERQKERGHNQQQRARARLSEGGHEKKVAPVHEDHYLLCGDDEKDGYGPLSVRIFHKLPPRHTPEADVRHTAVGVQPCQALGR